MTTGTLRIAFLHLAPVPGALTHNRRLMESAVTAAAAAGADWVLTPELCVSGYTFTDRLGTEWIEPQPDDWMAKVCRLAAGLRVTLFVSCPERDRETGRLYNAVFVITNNGRLAGCHRKINTLRTGSESWSTPGQDTIPITVPPFRHVGILICADAFSPGIASRLKARGAQLLISAAAWAPGYHGPNGEWEDRSYETGLPFLVCNRTGPDRTLDFTRAESVVVQQGQRVLSMSAAHSAIFLIHWDLRAHSLARQEYQRIDL